MAAAPSTLRWCLPPLPEAAARHLTGPDGPFAFHEETVDGRTLTRFTRRFRNLPDLLRSAVDAQPDRPYLVDSTRTLTYAEAWRAIGARAAALRSRGVSAGDRVALLGANQIEYILATWAALRVGAVVVGLNGWWTGAELRQGVELTGPSILLGDARRLERLPEDVRALTRVELLDEFGLKAEADAATDPAAADAVSDGSSIAEDAPALLLFTSGTTGRAKGAVLAHRNVVHAAQAAVFGGALDGMRSGGAAAKRPTVSLMSSPLFHVSGALTAFGVGPFTGATLVLPPMGRWDPVAHVKLLADFEITSWSGVPTQFWQLLEVPGFDAASLPALSGIGTGGANLPPKLSALLVQRFPHIRIGNGFGMTETFGAGTLIGGEELRLHPSSVGGPVALGEVQVRDALSQPVPDGEVGEIWLRNGSVFLGYWDDPDATAASLDPQGWYRTGDFGRVQDGRLHLESRRRDLIVRAGENIYPVEIENRLVEHPEIADAAVIGVPHEVLGHEVKACVVRHPGSRLDADAVRAWAATTLAGFKVPAHVVFLPELPYSVTGKVLKRELERDHGTEGTSAAG